MAPHIRNRARRLRIWEKELTQRGGVIQVKPYLPKGLLLIATTG